MGKAYKLLLRRYGRLDLSLGLLPRHRLHMVVNGRPRVPRRVISGTAGRMGRRRGVARVPVALLSQMPFPDRSSVSNSRSVSSSGMEAALAWARVVQAS